jgi:hypothetical protein
MVMYRLGIPLIPAEALGFHLGLTVPKEASEFFWHMRTGKRQPSPLRPVSGYGTRIYGGKYDPNKVFEKLHIPLTMKLKSITNFEVFNDFKKYLIGLAGKDFDILMCFHHGTLANDSAKDNGHVVFLDKIYASKGQIRFIDPTRGPKWKIYPMKKMYEAMKAHPNGQTAGFWEIYFSKRAQMKYKS